MDHTRLILRAARNFFAGTLLSRISGLARDIAMAACFGASAEVAAFMVAYRLANLFRRFVGEGNLAAGFTPVFEEKRAVCFADATLFYRQAARSLEVILAGVVAVLIFFFLLLEAIAPADWKELVHLSMSMTPGLFFICLYALHSAFLQCQKHSFWVGVAPVAFNLGWIAAAWIATRTATPMRTLAIGISVSFGLQWLLTAVQVHRQLPREDRPITVFSADFWRMAGPMALGLVGIGAVQINSALDALFARLADASGPAYLWYAIRMEQLPLALFGIALSGALLPPLARAVKQGDLEHYHTLLQAASRGVLALMIPCTFALIALGRVGISLFFGHGGFGEADVDATLWCLWGYSIGLVPSVFVLILAQGFYAVGSYRVPSIASLVSVGINLLLNGWFVFGLGWKAPAIALATGISSFVNWSVLAKALNAPPLDWHLAGRLTIASGMSALIVLWLQSLLEFSGWVMQLSLAGMSAFVYFGLVIVLARVLGIRKERLFSEEYSADR